MTTGVSFVSMLINNIRIRRF